MKLCALTAAIVLFAGFGKPKPEMAAQARHNSILMHGDADRMR